MHSNVEFSSENATRIKRQNEKKISVIIGNPPYKEKTLKDPTIREKFDTYRFADYKEQVIELIQKVCTVSVETVKIIKEMESIT